MCELLGVSESGYWAWCTRPPSDRELSDSWLTERIRAIHAASIGRYGIPRVHAMLAREGIHVGEKRVARLMALAGLQGAHRRRRKGCTVRVPGVEPFANLVGRNFRPEAPNRVWAADIKQIRTGEGWLYLAAVQDLFSRRIVGWSMDAHMRQEIVIHALTMAVTARKPDKGTIITPTTAVSSSGCCSARPVTTPGSPSRWARSGPVTTMRSRRRSSRP